MKKIIKQSVFLFSALLMSPITLLYLILNSASSSDSIFTSFAQVLSLIPGKTGSYLRAGFYRFAMTYCHPDARSSFLALFSRRDTELGSGVYIGPQCNIGKCKIEAGVLLGSGVHIMSGKGQHNFSNLNIPIKDQGGTFEKVSIGENTWIGNGALVMANIGRRCVVAAGAVVIDDVEDFSIVAGNPAKVIRKISDR